MIHCNTNYSTRDIDFRFKTPEPHYDRSLLQRVSTCTGLYNYNNNDTHRDTALLFQCLPTWTESKRWYQMTDSQRKDFAHIKLLHFIHRKSMLMVICLHINWTNKEACLLQKIKGWNCHTWLGACRSPYTWKNTKWPSFSNYCVDLSSLKPTCTVIRLPLPTNFTTAGPVSRTVNPPFYVFPHTARTSWLDWSRAKAWCHSSDNSCLPCLYSPHTRASYHLMSS